MLILNEEHVMVISFIHNNIQFQHVLKFGGTYSLFTLIPSQLRIGGVQ
jgi:hypothetical protein